MKHNNKRYFEGGSPLKTAIKTKSFSLKTKSYFTDFGLKRMVYTVLASLIAVYSITSCSSNDYNHTFQSPKMAIESYTFFLADLKEEKTASIQDLTKFVRDWQILSDSVWSCIKRDTTQRVHYYPEANYHHLHDSIREEMYRLVFSQPRTFKDVVVLKAACTPYSNDSIIKNATMDASAFFDSLDNNPTLKIGQTELLAKYDKFLTNTITSGINDKKQLMAFIREEDILFRSFLSHLHNMEHTSMSDITHKTEELVANMFKDDARLQPKDAVVYMAMRTNRRLLLNAQTCIQDIRAQRVKSDQQLTAYLFMVVQPYLAIDDFGMAVLSEKQRYFFEQIATDTPTAVNAIHKQRKEGTGMQTDFPKLLLKLHLSTF